MAGRSEPSELLFGSRRGVVIHGDLVGRAPFGPLEILARFGVVFFLALTMLTFWGTQIVESQIEADAAEVLESEGIDTSNLEVKIDYRTVVIDGRLPDETTRAELASLLTGEGETPIRDAVVLASESVPDSLGDISVVVAAVDGDVTITGNVPLTSHRDSLIDSAALSGARIIDQLTVSGLEPASATADEDITRLSELLTLFGDGISTANLALRPDGSLRGLVEAVDSKYAAPLLAAAGSGVRISAPDPIGQLDVQATWDGTVLVLSGDVITEAHQDRLLEATRETVGVNNVVNNLSALNLSPAVLNPTDKVEAFADSLSVLSEMNTADAWLTDTDITINGEIVGDLAKSRLDATIARAQYSGLRSGGAVSVVAAEPTLEDLITDLQRDLDDLQPTVLAGVVFSSGSDALSVEAQLALDPIVGILLRHPEPVVEISGHTDDQASVDYNLDLSQRRADAVRAYLIASGIDQSRLIAVGYGEERPVTENTTSAGQARNRRVEFIAQESL